MLKEKLYFERKDAIKIVVDFRSEAGIRGYAMAWLKLTNNAREYPNIIYTIENNSHSNNVYVFCNPKNKDEVVDFLTGIYTYYDNAEKKVVSVGKIISTTECTIGIPYYEYKSTCNLDIEEWERDIGYSISTWAGVRDDY